MSPENSFSWKIRHKNILRMKTLQKEHSVSSKLHELQNPLSKRKNQEVKM